MNTDFHFATPLWLLLLVIPLLLSWLPAVRQRIQAAERLQRYADPHLLPYLLIQGGVGRDQRHGLRWWKLVWSLSVLALAGPRWDYIEIDLYQPGYDVVILLDVSRSMAVADVKPSRITRARQEIEDLLQNKSGLRVGLIGYASVAHVVAPITDDAQTIRNLLPSLSPELVRLPGSRLSTALDRARRLLAAQPPGSSRHVLLISDGDFDEPDLEKLVGQLYESGIHFHALGIGTEAGGEVTLVPQGEILRDPTTGSAVTSRLNESLLRGLARAGGGEYQRAIFQDDDTRALVSALLGGGEAKAVESGHQRVWHEQYYLFVIIVMLLILPWFRSGRAAALQRL